MDWKQSAIFTKEQSQKGEKLGFIYTWAEYCSLSNTVGQHWAWGEHYMWELFAGHVMGSRQWKGRKICIKW